MTQQHRCRLRGAWGPEPPLGNATGGLSFLKNCEKEHF